MFDTKDFYHGATTVLLNNEIYVVTPEGTLINKGYKLISISLEFESNGSIFDMFDLNYLTSFNFNFNFDDLFNFFVIFLLFVSIVFGTIVEILWYTHFFNKHQVANYSKFVKKPLLSYFTSNLNLKKYYSSLYLEFFE